MREYMPLLPRPQSGFGIALGALPFGRVYSDVGVPLSPPASQPP